MVDEPNSSIMRGFTHNDSTDRSDKLPIVTVIIPTYNRIKWLAESIRSVLDQTFQDFEIIVVNDSGEDVSQIIQSFNDERLIYLQHSQNLGLSAARNTGLQTARGKYIAYLDDDDIYYKNHLAILIGYLENHPERWIAYTDAVYSILEKQGKYYVEIGREVKYSYDFDSEKMLYENYIPVLCLIHRKECLDRTGLFNPNLKRLEDWDLWIRLSRYYEFVHIKETTCEVRWRNDESTMTSIGEEAMFFAYLNIVHKNLYLLGKDAASTVNAILINKFEKFYEALNEKILFNSLDIKDFFGIDQLNIIIKQLNDLKERFNNEYSIYFLKILGLLYSLENNIHAYSEIKSKIKDLGLAQSTDREQKVQALLAQVTDKDLVVQSLSAQITEKEQDTAILQAKLLEGDQYAVELGEQLAKRDLTTQTLQSRLVELEQELRDVQIKATEQEQQISAISIQKISLLQEMTDLKDHLNQREAILQGLNSKLLEIYSSTAWKIIQLMWKVRLSLAPSNSKREKFGRKILNGFRSNKYQHQKHGTIKTEEKAESGNSVDTDAQLNNGYVENPNASIIIPVFNSLDYTKECLHSVYEFTQDLCIEIIIVNNNSTDGTNKWLESESSKHPKLHVISLDQNIGFGPAVNVGLKHSKGKYLVILNNDTIVSPGWLSNLLHYLDQTPSIGIISPVTNYVGEGPQIDENARNLPAEWDSIVEYSAKIANRTELFFEPNRLVFFCVVLRQELVDQIGDLDEGYASGNFEDDDYCLRARYAGYKLAIARDSFVYHHGSVTFKQSQISHSQLMEINRIRFYSKASRISTTLRPSGHAIIKGTPATISVIVRTKDRPGLLTRALTSLVNQTYNNFEAVIVNDGGEDITNLVDAFSSHLTINYIRHNDCLGRTCAINTGLRNAKGEWIGYLDDDDILYPWHFESLMQAVDNPSSLIYTDYNKVLFESPNDLIPMRLVGAPVWNYNRQELLVQNYLPIHSYLHKHNCLDEIGLWDENLDRLEDYEFLLRLSKITGFFRVRKVTCEYRFYSDLQSSITADGRKKYLSAIEKIYARNETDEPGLIEARQKIIAGLQDQIQQIEEILSRKTGSSAQREIIHILAGL